MSDKVYEERAHRPHPLFARRPSVVESVRACMHPAQRAFFDEHHANHDPGDEDRR